MWCSVAGCIGLALVAAGCNRTVASGPRAELKVVEEIRKTLAAGATEAGAGDTAAEEAVTGWATIKGKFKIAGAAPAQGPPLAAAKQILECSKHDVFDESLVAKGDALKGAVIFARTAKLPVNPDLATPEGDVVLDNINCRFEPHVLFARAGQNISVKNSDPFGHNTKIDSVANAGANFSLPAKSATDFSFAKEESLPVKVGCSIHPWMGAWVLVRDNPYGAISDDKGEFTIAKLPAGKDIEFQLWQEKLGFLSSTKSDQVKIDGKGRFKTKLEPDQELVLEFTVPAEG